MNFDKKRSISLYRVYPLLTRIGVPQTVYIEPLGRSKRFDDAKEYTVKLVPMECHEQHWMLGEPTFDTVTVRPVNGALAVTYTFDGEQEWILSVHTEEEQAAGKKPLEFHVYSLADDLYGRDPYRGDLHVHSACSDGKEDPVVVAANYRKYGFDFFALTDHHRWHPSDEILRAYADVPLGIKLFHGEEVHIPNGHIHIVNFGSTYSVNDLYRSNTAAIDAEVREMAEGMQTPKGVDKLEFAYRKWIVDEIRKAGGFAIAAHPHWICRQVYHMSDRMLEHVFTTGTYDAFELVGGQSVHENDLQNAFYQEQRAKGCLIPIVGSSDSHGTDPANHFGKGQTLVFAKDMEKDSLCNAIKNLYSVAIEQHPGEQLRVFGSYRLVKYARFLLDRYFPAHDELCVEEGRLMREYALGDANAGKTLATIADRVAKHRNRLLRGK